MRTLSDSRERVHDLAIYLSRISLPRNGIALLEPQFLSHQLFKLTLNVVGDDTVLLDTYDIIVVVPGTSY